MHLKYVAMRIHPSQVMQYEYLQLSLLCKLYRSSNTTPNETPEIQNLRCKKTRNSSFHNNFRYVMHAIPMLNIKRTIYLLFPRN